MNKHFSLAEARRVVQEYEALWRRLIQSAEAARREAIAIETTEAVLMGIEHYMCAFRSDWVEPDLYKRAQECVEHVLRIAESTLGGDGAALKIDRAPYIRRFIHEPVERDSASNRDRAVEGFSPFKLWEVLELEFGAGKGEQLAQAQAAKGIFDFFRLNRSPEMKVRGGSVELEAHLYSELRYRGGREVSWRYRESLEQFAKDFGGFLASVGLHGGGESTALRAMLEKAQHFESRDRVCGGEMEVTFFKEKLVFRFSQRLAGQLNEFISLNYHAPEEAA